jgi:hypothetical protein
MRHKGFVVVRDRRERINAGATAVAGVAAPAALIEAYRRSRNPWVLWAACGCVVAELIAATHWSVIAFAPEESELPWADYPAG